MAPKRRAEKMAKAKELWGSDEPDEDILDRFLKVKKFQEHQLPSYESDGIPSIISVDSESENESKISRRRIFADLEQLSNEHPDLESISEDEVRSSKSDLKRARELYEELRQMSEVTGGSMENLMEGINTSNESISSIIPFEKRQELSRFEMTLKQMIDEAKQMAEEGGSGSEEDELYRSPSIHSMAESVVSVIERRRKSSTVEEQEMLLRIPKAPERPPRSPSPLKMRKLSEQRQQQILQTPSPKVEQPQPSWPQPTQTFPSPQLTPSNAILQRRRSSATAKTVEQPLLGADR